MKQLYKDKNDSALLGGSYLRIAICDDERKQIDIIKGYLSDAFSDINYSVLEAQSGEELIEISKNEKFDLIFLDIEMKVLNGIETGNVMRENNPDAIIAFVTGFKDYALQAYKIRAFDYIIKPLTQKKFDAFARDARKRLVEIRFRKEKNSKLLVKSRSVTAEVPFNEIVYFEKSGHQIIVHMTNGENVAYYDSFKELKKTVGEEMFVQCHQGYIVSLDQVASYRDKVISLRGEFYHDIPVSKAYIKPVKAAIERRLFD